jgi:two-component system, NarL family, nitrate/nitrite response regulator NarL
MTKRTTVLVADDHPIYREGIARAIRDRPELELIGEAADGREAVEAVTASEPDVALLDIQLPELSGIEVAEAIRARGLATRVVILSAFSESELVYRAIAAGARGYLRKDAGRAEICDAVSAVARGDGVVPAAMQGDLLAEIQRQQESDRPVLTAREQEVLAMTAEGLGAREIAERLYLSSTTVKTHLQNVYKKLDVSDRAAAVAEGMRRGLLS